MGGSFSTSGTLVDSKEEQSEVDKIRKRLGIFDYGEATSETRMQRTKDMMSYGGGNYNRWVDESKLEEAEESLNIKLAGRAAAGEAGIQRNKVASRIRKQQDKTLGHKSTILGTKPKTTFLGG